MISQATHAAPLIVFILVFVRVSAMLVAAPIFSDHSIPTAIKIGLSATVALIFTPAQVQVAQPISSDPLYFAYILIQQILVGLAFALIFIAMVNIGEMAGELIGIQMGISIPSGYDKSNGESLKSVAEIYRILAMITFLSLDGQHWVLLAIGRSFITIPVTNVVLGPALLNTLMPLGLSAIEFSLGIALPLLTALLVADIVTGLIGRAIPALNMFALGLPLKSALAVIVIFFVLPFTIMQLSQNFMEIPYLSLWR